MLTPMDHCAGHHASPRNAACSLPQGMPPVWDIVAVVRRRSFLLSTAGLAGTAWATGQLAQAGPATLGQWEWSCPTCQFEVALSPTAVTISAVPPGAADALKLRQRIAEEPMVLVGAEQRPVVWQAGRWEEPDAYHRRLTVDASEMALRAELS